MACILLGCDLQSKSYDQQSQKVVKRILEKAGHKVEVLSIGPNFTQIAMGKKSSKGKIAIYMVNGADIGTYKDFAQGIKQGYYHVKHAYFGLQGYINKKTCSCEGAKSVKLSKAHDDNYSSKKYTSDVVGKTTAEVCEMYPQIDYACGSSREELGNNLVKVIGGEASHNSSSENSSTIKEALKDVLYGWDGDAECFIKGDTVYIRKIKSPSTATLSLIEGDNIHADSVIITDVNPSTVNHLTCDFENTILTIKDDYLIKRFGKVSSSVKVDESIKSVDGVKEFLLREWAKIKRDNEHSLECEVKGDSKWQPGWAYVYLPSFNIEDYMYVSKISQDESANGDWGCKLTLVDYPPGFGEPVNKENDESIVEDST